MTTQAGAVSRALGERISQLVVDLLPRARRDGSHYVLGNLDGAPGQSLKINLTGRYPGHWKDFATGERGDALALVKEALRVPFKDALAWAVKWLGGGQCYVPRRSEATTNPVTDLDEKKRQWARDCWKKTVPIAGTLAETYLREHRRINCPLPISLRFAPSLRYAESQYYPALVAAVQGPDRALTAVQRIFLDPTTANKASVPDPKKILGQTRGGAVRLAHAGETLVLAEGIETALTILEATSLPVWVTLGTSGLRGIIVPQTVRTIVLAVDNDQAGIEAAQEATARFLKEGRTVKQVLPPENCKDFNDFKKKDQ
jgi:hypothetical protein